MDKETKLHRREDPNTDRSARILHVLLGNNTNINILSADIDHPEDNHPLRIQARRTMQALRPTETNNTAELLLSGIGKAVDKRQIKAAQFLFSHLDFMKMEPKKLRDAFASAITDQTPVHNIRAVIETAEKAAPKLPNYNIKIAVRTGLTEIKSKLPKKPISKDLEYQIDVTKKIIPLSENNLPVTKTLLDASSITARDNRIIQAHHRGIPHTEIAANEGLNPRTVTNRLSFLRKKGMDIELRNNP